MCHAFSNSFKGRFSSSAHRACGFTFLELVVALLIAGVMVTGALPHVQAMRHATALKSETHRFQKAFSLARNTAITQRIPVTLCPVNATFHCANDWSLPLAVIRDTPISSTPRQNVVRIFPAHHESRITYNRRWPQIRYSPLGHTSGFNGSFNLCSGAETGRKLVLSQLGRLRLDSAPVSCPQDAPD
ncbi:GspH/FimT family pseudopilin [Vreelandella sp. EE22]